MQKILRTSISKNICERLLLILVTYCIKMKYNYWGTRLAIVLFWNIKSLYITYCHSFSFILSLFAIHCHSWSFLLLVIIRCHSFSFIVTRCHQLSFIVTPCTTRCHSLYHSLSFAVTFFLFYSLFTVDVKYLQ